MKTSHEGCVGPSHPFGDGLVVALCVFGALSPSLLCALLPAFNCALSQAHKSPAGLVDGQALTQRARGGDHALHPNELSGDVSAGPYHTFSSKVLATLASFSRGRVRAATPSLSLPSPFPAALPPPRSSHDWPPCIFQVSAQDRELSVEREPFPGYCLSSLYNISGHQPLPPQCKPHGSSPDHPGTSEQQVRCTSLWGDSSDVAITQVVRSEHWKPGGHVVGWGLSLTCVEGRTFLR